LPRLREHLAAIRPSSPDFEHIQAYMSVADKEPYIRHARQVEELIAALPHEPGDREHAAMVHTARQIVSFHEHFNLPDSENVEYREARAAENLRWWRDQSGDKIAYWAASPHTANAPQLRIASSTGDMRFASAGSYLRRWYGERYRSIGFTFGRGAVSLGAGQAATMPDPEQDWFERPLHDAGADQLVLDLRTPAPPAVRRWLDAPMRSRGLPDRGPDSFMDGGTPAQWFDVVVHRRDVTPTA
jgi:erythromycin esterase